MPVIKFGPVNHAPCTGTSDTQREKLGKTVTVLKAEVNRTKEAEGVQSSQSQTNPDVKLRIVEIKRIKRNCGTASPSFHCRDKIVLGEFRLKVKWLCL